MITPVPQRTIQQRMMALERANEIRTRRSRLKREIAAGRVMARDVLLDPPWWADTMKVVDLLLAVPKVGRVKVDRTLFRCRVSPSKTLGDLSERQRFELAAHLPLMVPVVRRAT